MIQEIGSVLGPRATARIATSALPYAPVLPVPQRRQYTVTRRLLGRAARARPLPLLGPAMHPMFVKLFLENDADDVLAEDEDRRRAANRARRSRARQATRVVARDRDRRPAR